jgi:hypothetical protein
MIAWLSAVGGECPSANTGAYSKARKRFLESLLQCLVPETTEALERQVPPHQQWCGRRVRVIDGTTVLMRGYKRLALPPLAKLPRGNPPPRCALLKKRETLDTQIEFAKVTVF